MAYLDPNEAFEHMRDQTLEALKSHFPIKGKTQTVYLDGFDVGTGAEADDIRAQHQKKLEGGSFTVPVHGRLRMVDNTTGKVIDEKKLRLADIPKMTSRYSYIVAGKEYQVANQWQLKPGAYTKRRENGELETQFNVLNRSQFDMVFHPESKEVRMEYKSAKLPVYSLLKSLGVTDAEMQRRLGKDVYEANKNARGVDGALAQFYKSSKRADAPDAATAEKHFVEQMQASRVDPSATKLTLGHATDHISGEALLRSMERLQQVQKGHPEDDRDSLSFKNLRSVGDFVADKIKAHAPAVRSRVGRQINGATDLRKVIPPGLFNAPMRDSFTDNAASELATQINPVEMLGKNSQTTVLGPGGIASEEKISDSVKLINQSHMGFQDTVVTPESSRTGVNLRLPLGLKKVGQDAKIYVYNVKTGKNDLITAQQFLTSNVVLPDQITWKNGKPHPLSPSVTMAGTNNDFRTEKFSKADYVLRHASQLFSSTTNLIPFLGNVSGNRASMATRHIEQAISLVDRDAPLVQSGTGASGSSLQTFDEVLGRHAAHTSPVDGVVHKVTASGIILKTRDGKKREVQLYNNFPLNDAKSVLHSNSLVKAGDKVKSGQVIADTNYSKNGTLALGKNLTTAYLSFKGYNFEDGLVISETAAKKLSSQHMHKASAPLAEDTVLNRTKFLAQLPSLFAKARLGHIAEDGVVQEGAKVQPGDPLVLAMRPYDLKSRTGDKSYQKALLGSHVDNSLRWDGETAGEVVAVHRSADGIQVHVRTIEPAKIGDKLSARSANKGVISMIVPDHEMPRTKDGQIIEIAMSPNGVPGRMNPSQILETAAGKIADKTGKTFIVPNFKRDHDAVAHVQRELKKHGLTDTEEVIDPVSGQSLGQVMVGKQHILKLVHQSDKKLSVASGMGLPGVPSDEKYDANLQSKSGQRLGSLGTYALLAHGAVHNLREMQTFKGEGSDPETDERKKWPTQHLAVWNAIQTGTPLPPPKPTFAFHKFTEMLKGSGINVEKRGHEMIVMPLTDKHIHELAGSRVLTRPSELLDSKPDKHTGELRPRAGGLFDTNMTGGHNGKRWSRIELAEPMPNPIFEAPIRSLTGLSAVQFKGIMSGQLGVTTGGSVVDLAKSALHGGHAIEHLLKKIDVTKELAAAKRDLKSSKASATDTALKKVKYLAALDELGMKAHEAYVQRNLAVIPPALRPASLMQDGNINYADINEIYKNVSLVNDQLKSKELRAVPKQMAELREHLYDGLKAVSGVGIPYANAEHKGLLHQISGSSPKCFDGETEVLTVGGWVRFDQYDGRSALATVNLEADRFDWQEPQAFHVTRYQGEMHHLLGRDVDLLVTPNHNHVLAKSSSKAGKRVWGAWQLTPSEDLFGPQNRSRLMTAPKNWTGLRHEYAFEGMRVDRLAFASFVGWWLAEGWLAHTRHVYVPQSSPAGIYLLDELMPRLGLAFQRKDYVKEACATGSVTYWWLKNRQLYDWLAENIGQGAENKFLSFEVLSWESDMLRALLEGYLQGDGDNSTHALKKQGSRRTHQRGDRLGRRFSTASRRLVDDLQQLALKIGLRVSAPKLMQKTKAHHLQQYRATVLGFRDVSFGEHLRPHRVDFDGWVYGPTVPNGTVIVRRNGQVSVSGNSGFFQRRVTQKRQDLSMAAVITPEPSLGLDEVGLPKDAALNLFRPFIVKKLQDMGYAADPLSAQALLAKKGPESIRALEKVMEERPVLLKRDPALHKYSIQGFQPRLVEGNTMKVHPLVCGGFGADFDGDTMRAFVPISKEAVQEAHNMKPTRNLFAEASGEVMYQPTLDAALGIYKLSVRGRNTAHEFNNPGKVLDAVRKGTIEANSVVSLNGKQTTAGRILLAAALPVGVQHTVLHDLDKPLDRGGLKSLLTTIGKEHTDQYDKAVNALKDMGNHSTFGTVAVPLPYQTPGQLVDPKKQVFIPIGAHTLSLKDLETDHVTRDRVLGKAHRDVAKIKLQRGDDATIEAKVVQRYKDADDELKKSTQARATSPSNGNLLSMFKAGVKPGWDQYKQLVYAPMLLTDSTGRTLPTPVTQSYSEGLNVAGYWTQMHGARRGSVQKVQQVQDPGYFSKLLTQSAIDTLISTPDCGTKKGVLLGIDEKDVHDRTLAQDFKHGSLHVKAGTMLDARTIGQIKAADKSAKLMVRSPLRCEHGSGVCQHCAGLSSTGQFHDIGTNIGVQAAQTVGERAVQLTLKQFHTGGVASGGSKVIGAFARLQQLTNLPEKIPNAATLAKHTGTIEAVEHTSTGVNVTVGGKTHFVGKDLQGHDLHKPHGLSAWGGIRVGQKVEAGESLSDPSRTVVNPRDLYKATKSIDKVQNYLTNEIYDLYKTEGIKRRHVETAVRAMSNLTKVVDPGEASGILHGEYKPMTSINALNRELMKAGRKPIEHTPIMKGIMTMPLDLQEDWMAKLQFKNIKSTLVGAAAIGAKSNLHSSHPIPALAYGAEIGLNKRHSGQPGLRHLQHVPDHHY